MRLFSICDWRDLGLAALLGVLAASVSFLTAQEIDPILFKQSTTNTWFESELPRVYPEMSHSRDRHKRAADHPLFLMVTLPANKTLTKLGLSPIQASSLVNAIAVLIWTSTVFALLRLSGCARPDTILLTLLGLASAASLFWFTVPETYPFGSISLLAPILLVAISHHRKVGDIWYALASAASLSITISNWMAGITAAFVRHPWRRALLLTAAGFFTVTLLWLIQKHFVPNIPFFIGDDGKDVSSIISPDMKRIGQVFMSFLFHTIVMPEINLAEHINRLDWPKLSVQESPPWSMGYAGSIAIVLWLSLFSLGIWGLISARGNMALRITITLVLIGQLLLHLFYGNETFLYSLHFLPLLLLIAAFGTKTRARVAVLILLPPVLIFTATNNWQRFDDARQMVKENYTVRDEVLRETLRRPLDPWPRGSGHVVLSMPGSEENDKSYHEPGGSFSPKVGSFGTSIWVLSGDGDIVTTSDDIPLEQLSQQFVWEEEKTLPQLDTKSPYYHSRWSFCGMDCWQLRVHKMPEMSGKLAIAVRSVGPAGGSIDSLHWDGHELSINDRWSLRIRPAPSAIAMGDETQDTGWKNVQNTRTWWQGNGGWGYARLELGDDTHWTLQIKDDVNARPKADFPGIKTNLELDLPDKLFVESLRAQTAHLLMGIVGDQTRSADPVNIPIPWQRTGAYIIVALVRAGYHELARFLSLYLAENDFYGGFGAEADAPGLALWALTEVALRINDPEYEKMVWPHVSRKAELILRMLSAKEPVYASVTTPIVPRMRHRSDNNLVAEPSESGLIIGRMDHHRPILYVNAVSYRGLKDAAGLALRMGEHAISVQWRKAAEMLQASWSKAFLSQQSVNDRTYISALWPTGVATEDAASLLHQLEKRWKQRRDFNGSFRKDPVWTYFAIAEAHQWLLLGKPDEVWTTLGWFWDNQASPGLFTWWEGRDEGNTFQNWNTIRGWLSPTHVTPHYWTTAEMSLLQLDMLGYYEQKNGTSILHIGAGIPPGWLDAPMSVKGLSTPVGRVDWTWQDGVMTVLVAAQNSVTVRLGPGFPPESVVRVKRGAEF